jgi:hypothetical protein
MGDVWSFIIRQTDNSFSFFLLLLLLFRLREKKKGFDILRISVPGLVYCTQIGMLLLLTLNGWGTN